jgi:hypothetical protein
LTSQVSREEIIAELHKAGVRPYSAVARLMNTIDKYSVAMAHRMIPANNHNEQFLADPYYYLDAGQWDLDAGVTRCSGCFKVRKWNPYFHRDLDHESNHSRVCKACLRKERDKAPPLPITAGWMCPVPPLGCGSRRTPAEFPEEKRVNPRRPIPCIQCSSENAQA